MELNEILQQRKNKLESLRSKGIDPYSKVFPERKDIGYLLSDFKEGSKVSIAGRIMAKRSHGKVTFMDLKDSTGKIQLYLKADSLNEEAIKILEELDIADFISLKGELFKTHTAEPTVKVEEISVLSKAIRPLPEKWHGLKDVEIRYRKRYLDLIVNEEVRKVFITRSKIIKEIRQFLDQAGFLEVETPMMHDIPGGASGRPFKTFHNEYDMELYLRIAPELYLKRLLVGMFDKVYEINRSFRNEGVSTRHNPEFTMLEVYSAYEDYDSMMELCKSLIVSVAKNTLGKLELEYQGKRIDLGEDWRKISFAETVKGKFAILPSDDTKAMLKKLQDKGFAKEAQKLSRSQISKIIEDILEQDIGANPTFVTDYFTSLCPLAKTKKEDPLISERFELYMGGLEVGNAYSELNAPLEQKLRFEEEIKDLAAQEKKTVDEDYCRALEHAMPPAGGLGIGVDRLVMLFTDQQSIRDVILFPLLRPES